MFSTILNRIFAHPKTTAGGILSAGAIVVAAITSTYGPAKWLLAASAIIAGLTGLLAQDPALSSGPTSSSPRSSIGSAKLGVYALCLSLVVPLTGCTQAQQQTTQTVISDISAYLPTVLSLVGAFAPLDVAAVSNAETQIRTDLNELSSLVAVVNPDASTWTNVQAVVNKLVSDGAAATNAALAIKDPAAQKDVLVSLAGVTAAIAIIDSYVTSGQTQSQVKAKLASRIAAVKTEWRTWTPAQRFEVRTAYGV